MTERGRTLPGRIWTCLGAAPDLMDLDGLMKFVGGSFGILWNHPFGCAHLHMTCLLRRRGRGS